MRCYQLLLGFVVLLGSELATPVTAADTTADFYVAPGGKDTWSGRLAAARADGSDGPLATLAGARDAVRRMKEQGPLRKPVRVLLRGGTYAVGEPVVFFEGDSGTKRRRSATPPIRARSRSSAAAYRSAVGTRPKARCGQRPCRA